MAHQHRRLGLLALAALVGALLLSAFDIIPAAASAGLDPRGMYTETGHELVPNVADFPHTITISTFDPTTGLFEGTGTNTPFNFTGQLTGSRITLHTTSPGSSYVSDLGGTVQPDLSMSGTWTDNLGQSGTWTATPICSGMTTSGAVALVPPPPSLLPGDFTSTTEIRFFCEQQNVVLQTPITLDAAPPGSPTTIPAGASVNSFFLHANAPEPGATLDGSVTLGAQVLGIAFSDSSLDQSDFLGAAGTVYPTGVVNRGIESGQGDSATIGPDGRTVTVHLGFSMPGDEVRIITRAANGPLSVTGFSPTTGPFHGGIQISITGTGFQPGVEVFFGDQQATPVNVVSSNLIVVALPAVAMDEATAVPVTVTRFGPSPGSGVTAFAPNYFFYFVPQIGVLVVHDAQGFPCDSGTCYFSNCTATVVQSMSGDVISTAGHCVANAGTGSLSGVQPGRYLTDWAFAPGFTGKTGLCLPTPTPVPIVASDYFKGNCGISTPFGVWTGTFAAADPGWLVCLSDCANYDRDYGFVDLQPQVLNGNTVTIQARVGGGLPITFNQGRLQTWNGFAEPIGTLLHCSGQTPTEFMNGPTPPPQMQFPCAPFAEGSSGGPWISATAGSIGGVNSRNNGSVTLATYLGTEAQLVFEQLDVTQSQAGPGSSLVDKLQAALAAVITNDRALACGALIALINEGRAQSGKKLTPEQAMQLIDAATQIRTALSC